MNDTKEIPFDERDFEIRRCLDCGKYVSLLRLSLGFNHNISPGNAGLCTCFMPVVPRLTELGITVRTYGNRDY
jgi:hypothetical protein